MGRSRSRSRKSDTSEEICHEYVPRDGAGPGYNSVTDQGIFTLSCCRRSIICISVYNILYNLIGIMATINTITSKQLTTNETISSVFEILFDIIAVKAASQYRYKIFHIVISGVDKIFDTVRKLLATQ